MKMHSAELKATAEQQWHEKVEKKANEGLGFGKKKKVCLVKAKVEEKIQLIHAECYR